MTTYDPQKALRIVERMAEGELLRDILTGPGMPSFRTFNKWVLQNAPLARALGAARELSAVSFEEEAVHMAREIKARARRAESSEIRAYEVAMAQLRWSAQRRNPQMFGDKVQTTIRVPIQINTTLDLGAGHESINTKEHPNIYDITASVVAEAEHTEIEGKVTPPPGGQKGPRKRVLAPPPKRR